MDPHRDERCGSFRVESGGAAVGRPLDAHAELIRGGHHRRLPAEVERSALADYYVLVAARRGRSVPIIFSNARRRQSLPIQRAARLGRQGAGLRRRGVRRRVLPGRVVAPDAVEPAFCSPSWSAGPRWHRTDWPQVCVISRGAKRRSRPMIAACTSMKTKIATTIGSTIWALGLVVRVDAIPSKGA